MESYPQIPQIRADKAKAEVRVEEEGETEGESLSTDSTD